MRAMPAGFAPLARKLHGSPPGSAIGGVARGLKMAARGYYPLAAGGAGGATSPPRGGYGGAAPGNFLRVNA